MNQYLESCLYENSALAEFLDEDHIRMDRKSIVKGKRIYGFRCIACGLTFNSDKDFTEHRSKDFQPGTGRKCYLTADLDMLGIDFRSTVI